MKAEMLERLIPITEEEESILAWGRLDPSIYTEKAEFIIDSKKLLEPGKLIEIRRHTRFIHFPSHRHNYIEAVYMCRGATTHIINGEEIVLHEGDLLFLNQRATHEILPANANDIAINFIILPEFFEQMYAMLEEEKSPLSDFIIGCLSERNSNHSQGNYGYLYFNVAEILPIQNLMEIMVYTILDETTSNRSIMQRTMALLLAHLMNFADKMYPDQEGTRDRLAVTVLKYIDAKYKDATLTELAGVLNYDLAWISKEIKRQLGRTFKELLHEKRMSMAVYLLMNTKMSVAEVMEIIGYENSSFFHKKFKEKYGMSPKEYRRNNI